MTMKRFIAAATVTLLTLGAAQAETVWVGNSFIDAVSGGTTCTSIFSVGDTGRLVFRPRGGALGNGGDSQLAYLSSRSAFQMIVSSGDFKTNVNYAGQSEGSTGNVGSNTGGILAWTQSPTTIGSGTPYIKVVAKFANFFRISGCSVTLRSNMIQR